MLKNVFAAEGPLFQFLSRLADMLILNLLFIACCIPVFTIGAALTAMSYVTQKMREGEDGYVARKFFKSFRQNFKQATLIWLMLLFIFLVLLSDFLILGQMGGGMFAALRFGVYIGAVFWLLLVSYAFPLLARFENTIKGTLRNALLMALANAPRALLAVAIFIGSIVLTGWNMNTLSWGLLLWILFGFAIHSYINSAMQYKIFHKFMPEEDAEDPDNWTLD